MFKVINFSKFNKIIKLEKNTKEMYKTIINIEKMNANLMLEHYLCLMQLYFLESMKFLCLVNDFH